MEDPRKTGLKSGLRQLTIEQLQRVLKWREDSVKQYVDKKCKEGFFAEDFIRTTAIGGDKGDGNGNDGMWHSGERTEETDEEIKKAMIDLLSGKKKVAAA
jgi:hypothetical protein